MEDNESTRPSIGFPLGFALLLTILCSMSCLFICCFHWDKLRSLLGPSTDHDDHNTHVVEADADHLPRKPSPPHLKMTRQNQAQSVPVLMPGDQVPKFIAMACVREPPVVEKIAVKVEKPPPFPIPLY